MVRSISSPQTIWSRRSRSSEVLKILREHSLIFRRRFKFAPPFYQAERPITNLAFAEGTKPHGDLLLYATTESSVLSFRSIPVSTGSSSTGLSSSAAAVAASVSSTLSSTLRDRRPFQSTTHQPQQTHSNQFTVAILESRNGCTAGCAVLAPELDGEQQFVIANSTGVFSYVGDDKRLGLGIEGDKLAVHWWFNYLITVTKESRKTATLLPTTTTGAASSLTNTGANKPQSNILNQLTAK